MNPRGVMGHFKRECPKLESPSGEKRVSFQENKGFKLQRGNSLGLSQPLIANIHGLKEVKEGGEVEMEGNQQDSLLRVNREVGDPPEGRVKFEGTSSQVRSQKERKPIGK